MARRKSKKPPQEDTSILVESSSSPPSSRINLNLSPALLFIIFTVGASTMGWFCVQQQHSLDQLSESFLTVERSIMDLQQVMESTRAQTDVGSALAARILALEEAQKLAEERVVVALETSEKMNSPDLYSQLWALRDEMDTRLAEMKRASLSVTTLQTALKNQSEELEVMKESVAAGLSFSAALAENVERLSDAVASSSSRSDEQVASVEALNGQIDGQAWELNQLKEATLLHNVALHANNQELAAIKELVEAKQAVRAQALEEMLSSVQTTLDEQFVTSQTLHSSVTAQLQTFHTQLAKAPSQTMKEESPAEDEEELMSTTVLNASDGGAKPEQQDAQDEGEEETEQDEQPEEDEGHGDTAEQPEEEGTLAEEEESADEEQEVAGETAEDEVTEETVERKVLDESSEEEVSQDDVERWETAEEESAESDSQVVMDENEDEE